MKKINRVINRGMYVCEVCNKEHYTGKDAELCEKRHSCKHKKREYMFSEGIETWRFNTDGIEEICSECKEFIDIINFENIEGTDIIKDIYNLIKRKTND